MKDSYEAELAETRSKHEREVKELKQDFSTELKDERESARDEIRKLKEDLYDSTGRRQTKELETQHDREAELNRYREGIDRDAERKVDRIQKYSESKFDRLAKENAEQIEEALSAQKQSNSEEMKPLYQELALYRNEGRDLNAERAKAREEVVSNYESDHQIEKQNIVGSYEKMLDSMRNKDQQTRDLYDRKLMTSGIEAEARVKKIAQSQKEEFSSEAQKIRKDAKQTESFYREELARERSRSTRNEDQLVKQSQHDTERALNEKDRAYGNYLQSNAKRVNSELEARERVIQDLSTTQDPRRVSPGVVNKIQIREEARHHENLEKLRENHKQNLDAIRDQDQEARRDLAARYEDQTRTLARDFKLENDLGKRGMMDVYLDLKEQGEARVGNLESQAKQTVTRLQADQARALESAQKRTRVALSEQRDSLKDEKDHALMDATQNQRLQDREWFMKLNDQRRDFDRKIAQIQDEHVREIADLKLESDRKLHEQDRTTKRVIEEKDRNLNYQIKQQEVAFKEKERFLVEHYEEELDKMKHTNAQLVTKKS
jgi:hypothetical protein